MAWELRWSSLSRTDSSSELEMLSAPIVPSMEQVLFFSDALSHQITVNLTIKSTNNISRIPNELDI